MSNGSLHSISSRLDRVFESSKGISDEEIKSHYARYLCILLSGYLEESIKIIIRDYSSMKASPNLSNYINTSLHNLTNLNCEKIGNTLSYFNNNWKDKFENSLTGEEKDSIDSVVANRHLIAHGQNVGVSYVRVKLWYKNIICVVGKISSIVNS
jgi:hypothetical protein